MYKLLHIYLFIVFPLLAQDIAFVGNSITASGYGNKVQKLLTGYTCHNFGVPGIAVAIEGYQYKDTNEYKYVLNLKPQHIVMLLGSHDWKKYSAGSSAWQDYWEDEYRFLANKFRLNSTLFIGTITNHIYDNTANTTIREMNKRIKKVANSRGAVLIDFNSALGNNEDYFLADGIHPNSDGKMKMAQTAYDILKNYPANKPDALPAPSDFSGYLNTITSCIELSWEEVKGASYYNLNRANINPSDNQWEYELYNNIDNPEFSDCNINSNVTYFYSVQAVNSGVLGEKSKVVMISTGSLGIHEEYSKNNYHIQNYPNPFNSYTSFYYSLPAENHVRISIFDILGNEITMIVNEYKQKGNYTLPWDGTDSDGQHVVGGIYFYRIQAGDFNQTKKLILLK